MNGNQTFILDSDLPFIAVHVAITPPSIALSYSFLSLCSRCCLPMQADGRGDAKPMKMTARKSGPLPYMFPLSCGVQNKENAR